MSHKIKNDTNYLLNVEALTKDLHEIRDQFHDSSSPNDLHDLIDKIDNITFTIDSKLESYVTLNKKATTRRK